MTVKLSNIDWENIVPNPRFGSRPIPSGLVVKEGEIRRSYWRYHKATIFPETAIKADVDKQNHSGFPRGYYVDLLEICQTCSRPFLFFAREQKFWYEDLGFYIDAHCVHCSECRRDEHHLREQVRCYEQLVKLDQWDDAQLLSLATSVVVLWKSGMLADEQKLRRIKNLAARRLPDRSATKRLIELVEQTER